MKVIWAIDAMSDGAQVLSLLGSELKAWAANRPAVIEPVYVMSAAQLRYPRTYFEEHRSALEAKFSRILRQKIAAASGPATISPRILIADRPGLGAASLVLDDYARNSGADLVALASHSHGLKRLAIGSFCELLLLRSAIPLLIVSSAMIVEDSIRTVLFPTDLLSQSDAAFQEVLNLTRQHQASLVLLHVSEYLAQHGDGTYGPPEAYYEAVQADKVDRLRKLEKLRLLAEGYGVAAKVHYIDDEMDPARAINAVASGLPGALIAMLSHKDADDYPAFSSVTRRVLHKSERPLWTCHRSLT